MYASSITKASGEQAQNGPVIRHSGIRPQRRMKMAKYIACCCRRKKCKECDESGAGIFERIDHGCTYDVEIGEYDTAAAARLAAMAKAKKKGTWMGGTPTGSWSVETRENGIIEAGTM